MKAVKFSLSQDHYEVLAKYADHVAQPLACIARTALLEYLRRHKMLPKDEDICVDG